MRDAMDYSWDSVRNYHTIILHQQELDQLHWSDTEGFQRLRSIYVRGPRTQATDDPVR